MSRRIACTGWWGQNLPFYINASCLCRNLAYILKLLGCRLLASNVWAGARCNCHVDRRHRNHSGPDAYRLPTGELPPLPVGSSQHPLCAIAWHERCRAEALFDGGFFFWPQHRKPCELFQSMLTNSSTL